MHDLPSFIVAPLEGNNSVVSIVEEGSKFPIWSSILDLNKESENKMFHVNQTLNHDRYIITWKQFYVDGIAIEFG